MFEIFVYFFHCLCWLLATLNVITVASEPTFKDNFMKLPVLFQLIDCMFLYVYLISVVFNFVV